ncbi:MAG: creatininase family protein [Pirellulaceae bacterium]
MQVTARVPGLDNQAFALGIPETIGCREAMLVNFPEAKIEWQGPDADGVVSCVWGPGGRVSYTLRLVPADDYIDVEMTIRNHTEFVWRDVFAFNFLQRQAADRPGLATRQQWARPVGIAGASKPHGRMEEMVPDQLEQVLAEAPVAFVPVGTYEHHGFHLPVCFDGIKAHALCKRVAQRGQLHCAA